MSEEIDKLSDDELADKLVGALNDEGVTVEDLTEENKGLGDAIESVLSKFGVTPERIERVFNTGGCGCGGRKKFLNKLFPFFSKKKDTGEDKEG